jgi:hypothetical protein
LRAHMEFSITYIIYSTKYMSLNTYYLASKKKNIESDPQA